MGEIDFSRFDAVTFDCYADMRTFADVALGRTRLRLRAPPRVATAAPQGLDHDLDQAA